MSDELEPVDDSELAVGVDADVFLVDDWEERCEYVWMMSDPEPLRVSFLDGIRLS